MDAEEWNERYRASTMWSGTPNEALMTHAPRLTETAGPRPWALDLGCGEGADALWLADHGWHVLAVDWAGVALERARQVGLAAGADVTFLEGDITDTPFLTSQSPTGAYDLVSVAFLHPEPQDRRALYSTMPTLVAPGGHLLVIAHDPEHGRRGLPGPPAHRLLGADDIVDALDLPDSFDVEVHTTAPRSREEAVVAFDSVVLVRRRRPGAAQPPTPPVRTA